MSPGEDVDLVYVGDYHFHDVFVLVDAFIVWWGVLVWETCFIVCVLLVLGVLVGGLFHSGRGFCWGKC